MDDTGEGTGDEEIGEDDVEIGFGMVLRAVERVLISGGEPRSTSTSPPACANLVEGGALGEPSGVNNPFSHLPEPWLLLPSQLLLLPFSEADPMELRRLSFEVLAAKAIPTNALVDALGLGTGEAVGVRRGEGSGNS